jgi:CopG-like RHH_1 or ribbon-helix-helix domain, RHH_5
MGIIRGGEASWSRRFARGEKGAGMATRVVVTLPDDVYRRVEQLAQLTNRDVADLLADTITRSLPPLDIFTQSVQAVTSLSDEDVMALTELQMLPAQDRRLSALLQKQQAQALSDPERAELLALMQVYQEGLLRKAQALREAVRRGLRMPLKP